MKLTDFNESFKHYKVKHKRTGKEYKVTAMHDKSALEKARAQHGGTASRYTGTSTSDFEIVEGIFTKHSDDPISGGGQSSPRKPVPVEGQVITLDNERYKVIKVSKDRKTFDVMNIKDPSETHFDIKVDKKLLNLEPGFVAIRFKNIVIGCAHWNEKTMKSQLPKSRRCKINYY